MLAESCCWSVTCLLCFHVAVLCQLPWLRLIKLNQLCRDRGPGLSEGFCFLSLSLVFHDEAIKEWLEVIHFCSAFLSLFSGGCWESSPKRTYLNTWRRWPTGTQTPSSSTDLLRPSSSSSPTKSPLCRVGWRGGGVHQLVDLHEMHLYLFGEREPRKLELHLHSWPENNGIYFLCNLKATLALRMTTHTTEKISRKQQAVRNSDSSFYWQCWTRYHEGSRTEVSRWNISHLHLQQFLFSFPSSFSNQWGNLQKTPKATSLSSVCHLDSHTWEEGGGRQEQLILCYRCWQEETGWRRRKWRHWGRWRAVLGAPCLPPGHHSEPRQSTLSWADGCSDTSLPLWGFL